MSIRTTMGTWLAGAALCGALVQAATPAVAAPEDDLRRIDRAIATATPGSPAHLRLIENRALAERELAAEQLRLIEAAIAGATPGSAAHLRLHEIAAALSSGR